MWWLRLVPVIVTIVVSSTTDTRLHEEATMNSVERFGEHKISIGNIEADIKRANGQVMKRRNTVLPSSSTLRDTDNILAQTWDINSKTSLPPLETKQSADSNNTVQSPGNCSLLEQFKRQHPLELWRSKGLFTDRFLDAINPHWLHFSAPHPASHYALAALYVIVLVVGLLGNALVIFMFVTCRSLRTPANILVTNLAVSDFVLLSKMPLFVFNSLHRGPALGHVGCQVYGFVGGLTGTVSIITLAAIALDRYYVIAYPLDPVRKTTHCWARLYVLCSWSYGVLFAVPPLLGVGRYVPEGYLTSCSFDYLDLSYNNRIYILAFFVAAWVVPFCIIVGCYIGICRAVSLTRKVGGELSSRHEKNRSELRLAVVVVGIITLWFVAWTPYAVVALLGVTGQKHHITPLSSMVPALLCKLASCIDPYIYAVTHPRFRLEMTSIIRRVSTKREARRAWSSRAETRQSRTMSEEGSDVEEMSVVVLNTRPEQEADMNKPRKMSRQDSIQSVTFPVSDGDKVKLQPPSWFVAPRPLPDRSTSFHMNLKSKDDKTDT